MITPLPISMSFNTRLIKNLLKFNNKITNTTPKNFNLQLLLRLVVALLRYYYYYQFVFSWQIIKDLTSKIDTELTVTNKIQLS